MLHLREVVWAVDRLDWQWWLGLRALRRQTHL
jgi:hypothetical protein